MGSTKKGSLLRIACVFGCNSEALEDMECILILAFSLWLLRLKGPKRKSTNSRPPGGCQHCPDWSFE